MVSKSKRITAKHVFPIENPPYIHFPTRRSVVHSVRGMVACTQPLAAEAGQRILKMGGNAADAAVAVAAAMNMTEPASTGIGGDMFCLYFDANTKKVHALNGSGRSPKNTTLSQVREKLGLSESVRGGKIPPPSPLAITVPGAAAGWIDTFEQFGSGKLTMSQVLAPAIELGEEGFPVSEFSARMWANAEPKLKKASKNFQEMLKPDPNAGQGVRAPHPGEIFGNPGLAQTFKTLAAKGKKGFYSGPVAQAIVDVVKARGGLLELSDLEDHMSAPQNTEPISLRFRGQQNTTINSQNDNSDGNFIELWEHPPNGQGIVALIALGILEELEKGEKIPKFRPSDHNTAPYLHAVIEAFRIAFADANWWVADPDHSPIQPSDLISPAYLSSRAALFDATRAVDHAKGQPGPSPAQNFSDTVYFAVTDKDGNGISFINSNFTEFGSCMVPEGCGFTLQNRGSNFNLGPANHPNVYAGGKRPYHTIIPGLITHGEGSERELHSVFGVMGGMMQPQGHVQLLLNMEVFGMNPQQALDAPRVCVGPSAPGGEDLAIWLEEGIDEAVIQSLREMGHDTRLTEAWERVPFGRGQIIRRHVDEETGQAVFSGGSDGRGDGCAMPA